MAGRGRGGGGGRGRGRASLSFNVEQLGLAPGEMLPGPVLQPPLLFPPLEFRPASLLLDTPFHVSQLQLKADFHDYFTKSSAFIQVAPLPVQSEQFADACQTSTVVDKPFVVDWLCVPPELKPRLGKKRKPGASGGAAKKFHKKDITNLNSWLEELEKKESKEEGKEKEPGDSGKKKNEEEQEGDPNDELEEEDVDEEMDDGTDYNQNYFDNGEGYLDDEDDNLDDGPIY